MERAHFSFHDADDNSENENSITLKRPESDTNVIEFLESEIKSIEIAKPVSMNRGGLVISQFNTNQRMPKGMRYFYTQK